MKEEQRGQKPRQAFPADFRAHHTLAGIAYSGKDKKDIRDKKDSEKEERQQE